MITMKNTKLGIEIGIKFIGATLSSWAIFSFCTDLFNKYWLNYASMNNAQTQGWIPLSFPVYTTVIFIIGLTLLFANFSKYME